MCISRLFNNPTQYNLVILCQLKKLLNLLVFVMILITPSAFAKQVCVKVTVYHALPLPAGTAPSHEETVCHDETDEDIEEIVVTGIRPLNPIKQEPPRFPIDSGLNLAKALDAGNQFQQPSQPIPQSRDKKDQQLAADDKATCKPVEINTGVKLLNEVDFTDTGEMPLSIVRNYSDKRQTDSGIGIFGRDWTTIFDMKLRINYSDNTFCQSGVSRTWLTCNGTTPDNAIHPKSIRDVTLISNFTTENFIGGPHNGLRPSANSLRFIRPNNTDMYGVVNEWMYSDSNGTVYKFDFIGRLTSITNVNGVSWSLTYETDLIPAAGCSNCTSPMLLTKVTHSSGRELNFTWSKGVDYTYEKKVIAITLPDGRTIEYPSPELSTKTVLGTYVMLSGVTYPNNTGKRTYSYERNSLKALNIDDLQWGEYPIPTYGGTGQRLASGLVGGVDKSTFGYESANASTGKLKTTTVTNAKGGKKTYTYDNLNRLKNIDRDVTDICPQAASTYEYVDSQTSKIKYKEDWKGNRTAYTYYTMGQLDVLESSTLTSPGTSSQVIQYEYANGITQEYIWDKYGRLKILKVWDGAKNTDMCKPGSACPIPRSVPAQVTEYTYNSDPINFKNRLQYSITRALKYNSTAYTPDRITTYAYEFYSNNLLKKLTLDGPLSGAQDKTIKEYNSKGDLTKITNANNDFIQLQYDNSSSGLVSHIIEMNGLVTDFSYDGKGRVATKTVKDGTSKVTKYEYYSDDQLKKITYPNRIDSDTDGLGSVSYGLDSARRVWTITRPDEIYTSQQTKMSYDLLSKPETIKNNYLTGTTSQLSTVSKDAIYDNSGLLKQSKGQNAQYVSYTYDGNQNIETATDALGRVTRFTYNAAGQIEKSTNHLLEATT